MSIWSVNNEGGILSSLGNLGSLATATATLLLYRSYRASLPKSSPVRPALVLDAIERDEPLYYFGVGSNLSRKKLEGRSVCGRKIEVLSMEPCVIPHHRLAFNMAAFPPLEPAMGSLEPLPSFYAARNNDDDAADGGDDGVDAVPPPPTSQALKAYERPECHGALIKLSAEDYERVYKSEGGGTGPHQGYEEIVVTCIPYDKSKPPVQALAFRAREHVRLAKDPCPSRRYMTIIREGARELGLRPCYQRWLNEHPVQGPASPLCKQLAINSMVFTIPLAMMKIRVVSNLQKWLLFRVYVLPTEPRWKRAGGDVLASVIMFPTACCGAVLRCFLVATGKMPPRFQKFIEDLN